MDLPLFPLHAVLCPGIVLPLHIFEPRYRAMVRHCLEEDARFGVVWIREGREVGSGDLSVASVGTLAEIREADRHMDGRYDLVTVGTGRFRIEEVFTDRAPYLVARAEPIDDLVEDEGRALRLARMVTRRFVRYVDEVRDLAEGEPGREGRIARWEEGDPIGEEVGSAAAPSASRGPGDATPPSGESRGLGAPLAIPGDPTILSHLIAGIVELDLPRRQALLERETTEGRLADLATILSREVGYLARGLRVYVPDPREGAIRRN